MYVVDMHCSRSAIGKSLLFRFVADESYALVEFTEEECIAVQYSYHCTAYLGSNLKPTRLNLSSNC